MITIPERVDATWIAGLADKQLVEAESKLHAVFLEEETTEKKRMGDRYDMMRGPSTLMAAWMRWVMVNNETSSRGVVLRRGRGRSNRARRPS